MNTNFWNQNNIRLRRCIPNEDDFSAEQPLEKEDPWLPWAHEDERRPSRFEEKTPARQKEAFGINFKQGHFQVTFFFDINIKF